MKRRILALFIIMVLTGVTFAVRILTHPSLDQMLSNFLVQQAEDRLGVRLELGSLEKNIMLTRVSMQDVVLKEISGEEREIKAGRLIVSLDPYAVFRGVVGIRDIRLEGIDLAIKRDSTGHVTVDPIFPFWEKSSESPSKKLNPIKVDIGNVTLMDVDLTYVDIPAGLDVSLKDVLIQLTRGRFDPKGKRNAVLSARSGEIDWRVFPEGKKVLIESLRSSLSFTGNGLNISNLVISSGPLDLYISGRMPFDPEKELSGSVSIGVDLEKFPWLIYGASGRLKLDAQVRGSLASPTLIGSLESRNIAVAGRTLERISANVNLDSAGCTIENARVRYRQDDLKGAMAVSFQKNLPFSAAFAIDRYPLQKFLEEIKGFDAKVGGQISAKCSLEGNLSDAGGEGIVKVLLDGALAIPIGGGETRTMSVDLNGRYQHGNLDIVSMTGKTDTLSLKAAGILSGTGPDIDLQLSETGLKNWVVSKSNLRIDGSLYVKGEFKGKWARPEGRFEVEAEGLDIQGYKIDLVKAHVDVDWKGIKCPMVSLKIGASRAILQGNVPWNRNEKEMFWIAETSGSDIRDLLHPFVRDRKVDGKISAHLDLTVKGNKVRGSGDVSLDTLSIYGENFDNISFEGKAQKGSFQFEQIRVVKDGRVLNGKGNIKGKRFDLELITHDRVILDNINSLKLLKVPIGGEIGFSINGSGSLDGKKIKARMNADWDNITFDGRPWRGGEAVFRLEDRTLSAIGGLLDGKFKADIDVELGGKFPFSGKIKTSSDVSHNDLNDLLGLRIPEKTASGQIMVNAVASGPLTDVKQTEVEGVITRSDFSIKGLRFSSSESIPFNYNAYKGIAFRDMILTSGESVIAGSIKLGPGTAIEGIIKGDVDLSGFMFLEPTVDTFGGVSEIELRVAGTLSEPLVRGYMSLEDVSFVAHLPFALMVENMTGRTEIVGDRLHFEEIKGQAGGGSMVMDGDIFFSGLRPKHGDLTWKAEGVNIVFPEGLDTMNRGNINMRFSDGRGVIRGSLLMDEGIYEREIDIDNLLALIGEKNQTFQSVAASNGKGSSRGNWLSLDVEMKTVKPIEVDIKLVRGNAEGSLHLQGTAAQPILVGRLEMDEGTVDYRGKIFTLTHGSVGFFNPTAIEPSFDFSGRTDITGFDRDGDVKDYIVELVATGVPSKFKLDLVSSPPMSEVDIISLLTWGTVAERAFASRSGLSATEATLLITRELKGQLESGVERLTGFDRFVIDPSSISSSGEKTTRIRVDKRLGDKLSLAYSTPILASEEQEVLVRYRITDNFSVVGEQDGEADYGLDLDFKFEIQ